ncbi:MAG: hypothetical protein WC994_11145 [Brumimicrobium sp.]
MAKTPVVRASDDRNGKIAAVLFLLVVLFLLFFITYTEPDPPLVTAPIPIVMEGDGIDNFDIDNGGGGTPDNSAEPVPTNTVESPREEATQEESDVAVQTGQGTTESNTSESNSQVSDPFGNRGSGGSGLSGDGTSFGSDDGPGTGNGNPGAGSEGNRIRLNNVTTQPKTPNNEHAKIAYKLVIDSRGKVIRADVIRNETTTTNQTLIDEVTNMVKEEVLYKEKKGARNEIVYFTVTIRPN